MKLNGKPLPRPDRDRHATLALLGRLAWVSLHAEELHCPDFIDAIAGRDCYELTPSCFSDEWRIAVHQPSGAGPLIYETGELKHIADAVLYRICMEISGDAHIPNDDRV